MRILSIDPLGADTASTVSGTYKVRGGSHGPTSLTLQMTFARAAGGTSVDAYVQTSFNGGASWVDIAQFSLATTAAVKILNLTSNTAVTTQYTGTDGGMTANTCKDGVLGDLFRVKYVTAGTYTGASYFYIDAHHSGGLASA